MLTLIFQFTGNFTQNSLLPPTTFLPLSLTAQKRLGVRINKKVKIAYKGVVSDFMGRNTTAHSNGTVDVDIL